MNNDKKFCDKQCNKCSLNDTSYCPYNELPCDNLVLIFVFIIFITMFALNYITK